MEITEPRRLYQQLAADLKERIEQGVYLVGDKLPAERFIADEKNVSRTVVREAIIMLEVEGYVEVRKGSGSTSFPTNPDIMLRQMKTWNLPATVLSSCSRRVSSLRVTLPSLPPRR